MKVKTFWVRCFRLKTALRHPEREHGHHSDRLAIHILRMTFCTLNALFRGIGLGMPLRFQLSWHHCGGANEEPLSDCRFFDERKLFCVK
jgi:hypothetical protein